MHHLHLDRGAVAALASAALFGAGAPAAKALLADSSPWMLAGILYTASGLALALSRKFGHRGPVGLARRDLPYLIGAVGFGGVVGPVLLMTGLQNMPASGASLLLNAEGIFTALIAWVVMRESTSRRIILGFVAIAAGALVLSWPGQPTFAGPAPTLAILGGCLAWGIGNNLTGRISLADATWLAMVKGLVAGPVNLLLAVSLGAHLPALPTLVGGGLVGVLAYGISLVLFIVGMRHLGAARAGAHYAVAPFFGAAVAVAAGEPVTRNLLLAGALMAFGVWLHVTEKHQHEHVHTPLTHTHAHTHDDLHHGHQHKPRVPAGTRHVHGHTHDPVVHSHQHYPDAHHQHDH